MVLVGLEKKWRPAGPTRVRPNQGGVRPLLFLNDSLPRSFPVCLDARLEVERSDLTRTLLLPPFLHLCTLSSPIQPNSSNFHSYPPMAGKSLIPFIGSSSNSTYNLTGESNTGESTHPGGKLHSRRGECTVGAAPCNSAGLPCKSGARRRAPWFGRTRGSAEPFSAPFGNAIPLPSPCHEDNNLAGFACATADNGRARSFEGTNPFSR